MARHGRTASNAGGLLLGRADPPLDEVGRDQAARLAASLAATPGGVDRIVSSPLGRTAETAAAVGAATGVVVEFDDRFLELDYGDWDQRPLADVSADEWARWRADIAFAPPGGESLQALGVRVRSALDELATERGTVVVVSHVSPVKAAVAWAVGGSDDMSWRLFVAPASVTRIATAGGVPSLHAFNDTSHLG
ncbi:MAG: histidine phosphatase family protein [Acidimicrobiales bacterium]